jgi:hypothetical protein
MTVFKILIPQWPSFKIKSCIFSDLNTILTMLYINHNNYMYLQV